MNITLNEEKNGIEVRFNNRPESDILDSLKENGFRWSGKQKLWYAKQSEERMSFLETIRDFDLCKQSNMRIAEKSYTDCKYDLWAVTRTENIEDNFSQYHIYDAKEIAAKIRKHLRERFPMCKWSVRIDHYDYISIKIKSSPFEINSPVLEAIAHYAHMYTESWNYDNSDIMTDYFDVNFYSTGEYQIVEKYDYIKTEASSEQIEMESAFMLSKEVAETEQKEKEQHEFEMRMLEMEREKEEAAKRVEIYETEHENIISGATMRDVDYFILNLEDSGLSKEPTVEGYFDDEMSEYRGRINAKVSKELHFSEVAYNLFKNHLLDNFEFFNPGLGGTATDDLRIASWSDYSNMTQEERDSVETYATNCVAVYCDGELKIVIDTEGFSYARYCYLPDGESCRVNEYKTKSGISAEEFARNKALADKLIEGNENISEENIGKIKDWIYSNNFPMSYGVVRAINDEKIKLVMYKLLREIESISEQFEHAGLIPEQKITMIQISDFGGLSISHARFKSFEIGKYAQYDNSVKVIFRPEHKRSDYYRWLHGEVLIYDGWLDLPEEILWETVESKSGLICKKAKYLSCDRKMYDAAMSYFSENGINPIINTYKAF